MAISASVLSHYTERAIDPASVFKNLLDLDNGFYQVLYSCRSTKSPKYSLTNISAALGLMSLSALTISATVSAVGSIFS
jgi:hypothetical protein